MNNFFITGLPRSRTAWLSSFFTGQDSFCYHEILRVSKDFEDATQKLLNRSEMYVGNSDSSMPLWIDKIDHILNNSPIVIVERDINEVTNSLVNLFGNCNHTEVLDLTLDNLEVIKKRYNHISIDYNKLSTQSCLETIWNFCTPNIPFDKDKFETLKTLNISIDINTYINSLLDKDGIKKIKQFNEYINKK